MNNCITPSLSISVSLESCGNEGNNKSHSDSQELSRVYIPHLPTGTEGAIIKALARSGYRSAYILTKAFTNQKQIFSL